MVPMRSLLVLASVLAACKPTPREEPRVPPPQFPITGSASGSDGGAGSGSGGDNAIAELHLGDRADDERTLAFAITSIVPHQQPTAAPPWHAAGGGWTYLEARLIDDEAATFAMLVPALDSAFAKMQLLPTTATAGARVVAGFARAFHVAEP